MRRVTTLASFLTGAVFALSASQAFAAEGAVADVQNGEKIFKEGKGSVPACTTCHGPKGLGDDSLGTPRLAGQIPQFLRKQLEDFATDKRKDTTMFVMNANAKGLSDQDRRDVSAYLFTLAQEPEIAAAAASDVEDLKANGIVQEIGKEHLGKALVLYGDKERGIPACRSCHGYNGRGVDPIYPKIGQQKYVYLVSQLKKWREGSRTNDPMDQMQVVARKLSDEDIRNVATYLTSASPYSMGNTRLPEQHPFMAFDIH